MSHSWYLDNIVGSTVSPQEDVISFVTFLDSRDTSLNATQCLKKCDFQTKGNCLKSIICTRLIQFKSWNSFWYTKKGTTYHSFHPFGHFFNFWKSLQSKTSGNSQVFSSVIEPFIGKLFERIAVDHFSTAWLMLSKVPTFIFCRSIDKE